MCKIKPTTKNHKQHIISVKKGKMRAKPTQCNSQTWFHSDQKG